VVRDSYVSELIEKIYEKHLTRSPLEILELKALMYLLVSYLIKQYTYKSLPETVYTRHFSKLNKINQAVNYISENYDKPLTTKKLASMAHLSEGYFCQIFKDVTGKTAMEYINGFRIDKAEKMLRKTDLTVTEIAFCCGFDDANYFSRIYKKIKGENPQAARSLKE
jgi:AraC-like DNA-binding protein